jgi:hypothetical protein
MEPKEEYRAINGEKIIKELNKRNMEGHYCSDGQQAVEKILSLLPKGASISWGGSMTLEELGVKDKIKERDYTVYDRAEAEDDEEKEEIYHQALNCDYFLMSSNALTRDGKLVNVDGNGNRVAALIYGPTNVIVVAGLNKLADDEESARQRVRNYAAPTNSMRLDCETPCKEVGYCVDCKVDDCICCQTVITRMSGTKNRIKVVLVGEELGY